jgi:hypothetical protein
MNRLLATVHTLEGQLNECNTRQNTGLQECETARRKTQSNMHQMPEGRIQFKQCYKEEAARPVLTNLLGRVTPETGARVASFCFRLRPARMLECARLATKAALGKGEKLPAHFATFQGGNCYYIPGRAPRGARGVSACNPETVGQNATPSSGCSVYDQRGSNLGPGAGRGRRPRSGSAELRLVHRAPARGAGAVCAAGPPRGHQDRTPRHGCGGVQRRLGANHPRRPAGPTGGGLGALRPHCRSSSRTARPCSRAVPGCAGVVQAPPCDRAAQRAGVPAGPAIRPR